MTKITESNKPVFSLSEQALCLRREIRMRWAVYPGRVTAGKMTQGDMDREIGLMDAAADTVEKMAKNGLFRESWNVMASVRQLSPNVLVEQLLDAQSKANQHAEAGELEEAYTEAIKLAGLTLRLVEIIAELKEQPAADVPAPAANPTPALPAPLPTPQTAIPAAVAQKGLGPEFSSSEQRAEIIQLLAHPAMPRQEKTNQLLNINRRTPEQATAIIAKLKQIIVDAEGQVEYKQAS